MKTRQELADTLKEQIDKDEDTLAEEWDGIRINELIYDKTHIVIDREDAEAIHKLLEGE